MHVSRGGMLKIRRYATKQLLSYTSALPCLQQQACNFPITNAHWSCFDGISVCLEDGCTHFCSSLTS